MSGCFSGDAFTLKDATVSGPLAKPAHKKKQSGRAARTAQEDIIG
jgi:hypothetical protein